MAVLAFTRKAAARTNDPYIAVKMLDSRRKGSGGSGCQILSGFDSCENFGDLDSVSVLCGAELHCFADSEDFKGFFVGDGDRAILEGFGDFDGNTFVAHVLVVGGCDAGNRDAVTVYACNADSCIAKYSCTVFDSSLANAAVVAYSTIFPKQSSCDGRRSFGAGDGLDTGISDHGIECFDAVQGQDEGIRVGSIGFIATIHINADDFADVGVIAHAGETWRKAML